MHTAVGIRRWKMLFVWEILSNFCVITKRMTLAEIAAEVS